MALTRKMEEAIHLGRGGSYSKSRDAIKHYLYDTRIIPAAVADFTFFSQPIGAAFGGGVKTLNETNMTDSGKLPAGQTFLIERIGFSMISWVPTTETTPGDLAEAWYNMFHSSIFEIRIAGRDSDFQTPGSNFVPSLAIAEETATDIGYGKTGEYMCSGWLKLQPAPIFLDEQVSFNVLQRLNNPIAAVVTVIDAGMSALNTLNAVLQCKLEGVLTRAK